MSPRVVDEHLAPATFFLVRFRALVPLLFGAVSCAARAPSAPPPSPPLVLLAPAPPKPRTICGGARCVGWSAILLSGGRDRDDNVVAHEHNVEFASRTLAANGIGRSTQTILFGDGDDPDADVQVEEPDADRRRLLYAIGLLQSGDEDAHDATLRYRTHEVDADASGEHDAVLRAFADDAARARAKKTPDDLFVYVTDHGLRKKDLSNNVIVLWGKRDLSVRELGASLDAQPESRRVVTVMAQCFSGSFANLVHEGGDPAKPLARHDRCGFFAAPADRPAAGCSPKNDESLYDDYTTRFFSALGGVDRSGNVAAPADLDGDGRVSFEEAHLAAIVLERTQDVPVSSSEEYLRAARPDWLAQARVDRTPLSRVLRDARPAIKAAANALLAELALPDGVSIRDLRERAEKERDACWPGLCEADQRLKEERVSAHRSFVDAAEGTVLPPGSAGLSLVVLGRPRIERWIARAQPHFDEVLRLESEVDRLRTESETHEARLERLARLAELTILEKKLAASRGELSREYARIRACETGGPWGRDISAAVAFGPRRLDEQTRWLSPIA